MDFFLPPHDKTNAQKTHIDDLPSTEEFSMIITLESIFSGSLEICGKINLN